MVQAKILVVEDEPAIRDMLDFALGQAEFQLVMAGNTEEASQKLADLKPDLILLDWMLPGKSGIEFARQLKMSSNTRAVPIIMLTARGEEDERIRGLEVGADDYVTKPFSPRELLARIKAVLRRTVGETSEDVIDVNGLVLDGQAHRVTADGNTVEMGPTEFKMLHFLMNNPERVYSRAQLLDRIWGDNVFVEERTVDVHIRRLRKALETSGHDKYIQTVRGAGYRFSRQV